MAAFDITLFNELAVDECRITQVSTSKVAANECASGEGEIT
ncbi:hypothetical protein ECP02994831_4939 [Escherichia coli P0299483.1]|nr:hypothetical protein CSC02_5320 [Enterobacter hormaechei subsp. hoffmannii]END63695.1 hypothetical protein ECP02994831_4939 [Escherichia coli P0299483.1]